jgi:hypothetical protein
MITSQLLVERWHEIIGEEYGRMEIGIATESRSGNLNRWDNWIFRATAA